MTLDLLKSVITKFSYTSKGSFCSRKKIVKVSFPGVAVCGSCGVWGSRGVEDLRCGGVAV